MPIYEYRCDNEHTFDALQKFSDEALTECEVCGAPARRVLHPVAIHFKGSGFYTTDYGRGKKKAAEPKADGASADGAAKSGSGAKEPASSKDGGSSSSTKAAEA